MKRLWIAGALSLVAVGMFVLLSETPRSDVARASPQTDALVAAREKPRVPTEPSLKASTSVPAAAAPSPGAHLLTSPPVPDGAPPRAEQPSLERALEHEEPNPVWTDLVRTQAAQVLAADPAVTLDEVRCVQSFCRLRMTKPIASKLDWPDIDQALAPIARGETIFAAEPHGTMTTAYVYFSADDANLPLSNDVHEDDDEL